MLSTPNRLPTPLVKQVMRSGKRRTNAYLIFIYQSNSIATSRFTVVVPKSVDKRAVGRNRIKRLLREAVRNLLPEMRPGIDGVVIVRKKVNSLEVAEKGIRELVLGIREA